MNLLILYAPFPGLLVCEHLWQNTTASRKNFINSRRLGSWRSWTGSFSAGRRRPTSILRINFWSDSLIQHSKCGASFVANEKLPSAFSCSPLSQFGVCPKRTYPDGPWPSFGFTELLYDRTNSNDLEE